MVGHTGRSGKSAYDFETLLGNVKTISISQNDRMRVRKVMLKLVSGLFSTFKGKLKLISFHGELPIKLEYFAIKVCQKINKEQRKA